MNGERVLAVSANITKSAKEVDECEIMRIEYLKLQGNMVQDIKTESGKIVHNVHLRVLEIIE